MVPQLSKEIHSNFSYQYQRRSVSSPRRNARVGSSDNASSVPEAFVEDHINLLTYKRCYVEDFMTRTVGESLIVLLPHRYQSNSFSPWYEMMSSNTKLMEVTFSKKQYIGYVAVVTINPNISQVQNGMHYSDYTAGFGNNNYGCNLMFRNDLGEINYNSLVTWKVDLDGRQDGIQIWSSGSTFWNVYQNFCD